MNIRLTLMRVCCERCFIGVKLTQEGKSFSATLKHQFRIGCATPHEAAQVIPIPFCGLFQFSEPFVGHKGVAYLPELGHDKFSDECIGHGPIDELIEVPDVARLLTLIRWNASENTTVTLKGFLFDTVFAPLGSPVNASLYFAIAFDLAMFLVVWLMWRKRWFIKV